MLYKALIRVGKFSGKNQIWLIPGKELFRIFSGAFLLRLGMEYLDYPFNIVCSFFLFFFCIDSLHSIIQAMLIWDYFWKKEYSSKFFLFYLGFRSSREYLKIKNRI